MAAAARPGPPDARDARVPCPLCGGLIHPIAGKCKHCKADLTAYRSARPAASAPLPALSQIAAPGDGQPAPAPIAPTAPTGYHVAPPVLPPHPPTPNRASQSAGATWRSWPIFVIVVAMTAIVAAVVLMMWPARGAEGKRALPPPAPERMDTRTPPITPDLKPAAPPPAPQGGVDPWSARPADPHDPGAAQTDPSGPSDPSDPSGTSDPDDLDLGADDPVDPFASPHAPRPRRPWPTRNAGGTMEIAMMAHLCQKLARCGITNAQMRSQARRVCYTVSHMPVAPPTGCLAAQRCLGRIDAMTCTDQPDALQAGMVLMQSSDCVEATRC